MSDRLKFEFGTGSYRPSKKFSNPEWIFKLLERASDTFPKGPACDACANLILLFTPRGKPLRHVGLVTSKNALQHRGTLTELANSSMKCGLCALMLACCNKSLSRANLDNIVTSERDWRGMLIDENEPFRVMLEECFGSGKLIAELRVTIQLYPAKHIADNVLRVYSDTGVSLCHCLQS